MEALEAIREELPEAARDLKVNLQSVLQDSSLSDDQKWGVAVACAIAARHPRLREAVRKAASERVSPEVLDDARAAAALMAMNNVFYRFRHMVGKEEYGSIPARLRMNRIAKPLGSRIDFELYCLAVSAIHGCEMCIRSHEKVVVDGGLTPQQVQDSVRIASTLHGVAVALEG